jgi:feruloyl-CoA synthase
MLERFEIVDAGDGATIVRARQQLGAYARTVGDDVRRWAAEQPEAVFIAERGADGAWRNLRYGETLDRIRGIGAGLLAAGASPEAPVAVVAENGIACALVLLAGMYVGVPVSPISVGYAGPDASPERLRALLAKLGPAVAFAGDVRIGERIGDAAPLTFTDLADIAGDPATADAAAAHVGPDSIAKIMFTSGSTGTPKGTITTHRMLCSNQAMLAAVWPEVAREPVTIVDWLPWSHCFGGSHNFGLVLHSGGTLYVDAGRPAPGPFEMTIRNVAEIAPNVFFSVPRGVALLVERFEADAAFAARFFSRVRIMCNAGASLPDPLREALFRFAARYAAQPVRVTSSWGTTETAPLATTSWGEPEPDIDTIGTPVPGVAIKLAPSEGRAEIRVKGPNITPGYWRDPLATQAAFDEDGFYRTGDAARLKDPNDAARGIVFEGRLAENFKLTSGTWVNVGAVRLALLERGAPVIEEVVVSGHDRDEIAALLFVSRTHAATLAGVADADHASLAAHPAVRAFVSDVLGAHNAAAPASSTRVVRASIVPEAPNRAAGEITDKGTINQRRALDLRAAHVAELHTEPASDRIVRPRATPVTACVRSEAI